MVLEPRHHISLYRKRGRNGERRGEDGEKGKGVGKGGKGEERRRASGAKRCGEMGENGYEGKGVRRG